MSVFCCCCCRKSPNPPSVFVPAWVLLAQSSEFVFLFARESLTHPFPEQPLLRRRCFHLPGMSPDCKSENHQMNHLAASAALTQTAPNTWADRAAITWRGPGGLRRSSLQNQSWSWCSPESWIREITTAQSSFTLWLFAVS